MKSILHICLIAVLGLAQAAWAQPNCYRVGVVNQRTPLLTAQYWNPILRYVSKKSGVPLCLAIGKTDRDTVEIIKRGDVEFALTARLFDAQGRPIDYRVLARPEGPGVRAQIVVLEDSAIRSLQQLAGKEVAFPSTDAPIAYKATMAALHSAGVKIVPSFSGNVEGAVGQLKSGSVAAAGVNSKIIEEFARREHLRFRALWSSRSFPDFALVAHSSVAESVAQAVLRSFLEMPNDPRGLKIMRESADMVGSKEVMRFVPATNKDYETYRPLYRDDPPEKPPE
jgi:phosphonate transport system substrate-binding protein